MLLFVLLLLLRSFFLSFRRLFFTECINLIGIKKKKKEISVVPKPVSRRREKGLGRRSTLYGT